MSGIFIYPKMGDIPARQRNNGYYVYLHRRASNRRPFYVGKGRGCRAWRTGKRNQHWTNCARKNGVIVEILYSGMSESEAIEKERETISSIGIENLTNMSTGGESGATGITPHNIRPVECSNGMTFSSAKEAEVWLRSNGHPKASGSTVTGCCRGRFKSAHGFDWRYAGDDRDFDYVPRDRRIGIGHAKAVVRGDGQEFESATQAAKIMYERGEAKTRYINGAIGQCCKGGRKTVYGYTWKYKGA